MPIFQKKIQNCQSSNFAAQGGNRLKRGYSFY